MNLFVKMQVQGHHIRVDRASGARKEGKVAKTEYDRSCSVFVGNLPFDVKVVSFLHLDAQV